MRADGCGARRVAPHNIPSAHRSEPNANRPLTLGIPSGRGALSPMRGARVRVRVVVVVVVVEVTRYHRRRPLGGALLHRVAHRLQDPAVAGAPAEVPGDRLAHFELARIGAAREQVVHGHHESGRAEAALHGAGGDERLLDVGERGVVGDGFHRRDLGVFERRREHEARAAQHAVDEHRAGATLPLLARVLRAGKPEPLAQHVQQALADPAVGDVVVGAVDREPVRRGGHPSARSSARRAQTSIARRRYAAVER